jgi:hypothetical protein
MLYPVIGSTGSHQHLVKILAKKGHGAVAFSPLGGTSRLVSGAVPYYMGCALSDQTLRMGEYYEVLRGAEVGTGSQGDNAPRIPGL